ncbi:MULTISPECIES: lipoprotein-releasing ABC transporter permease subunit LolC [unclassified Photobacterium]|uniref:lipoprotein-releasing ABC transporter permease subunit LolC n=1 Tax=unclassified Photobacterium TaxID=2628852 RepID=UPI000D17DCC7|nr:MULTISPECIES: lipoprotein-releasing ABC transporter permease subunit LolC [unclassified Photobacterium]PSV29060.1 lipoprotein-releasing ABC transporter permease subunit LolC [Photobacterium sp. GB-56]PSV33085.1 lipoprotein-releasing ABC transporter permease subunit LolC [Photobacterium sp. GB-72]PSV33895.1 lipoprotein-releasing ABC transporter permease subunit LolC [Photobacterium sp. GB-27]PSV40954.1 lipoprotein-releasing ABC transporter permease subunit LolC [Photobacterium sp. GB-210]PSV
MFHPVSFYIGLRYLRGRSGDRFSRFVSYMSTAGITIGVMALITVMSVMNGFEDQLKGRILGVLPQAVVSSADGRVPLSENAPEALKQLPHVTGVTAITRGEAIIQSANSIAAGTMIGIEPNQYDPISRHMMVGSLSDLTPGSFKVVIGQALAVELGVQPGDKIRLMVTSASQFTPIGRMPSQRKFEVSGIYDTGSDVDNQLVYTNISDAGRLLRYKQDQMTGWRLYLDDPFVVPELAKLKLPNGWTWSDWREQRGELFQAVKMEKNMMGLMLSLIIGVAAFNIISALVMVVMEKQSEVAILKTQGMTHRQVLMIFIVQGASSGVIGALLGGLLGALVAHYLNAIISVLGVDLASIGGTLPTVIEPMQIMFVILGAISLSLLATIFPSYRAAAVRPAEALRYE